MIKSNSLKNSYLSFNFIYIYMWIIISFKLPFKVIYKLKFTRFDQPNFIKVEKDNKSILFSVRNNLVKKSFKRV
jgi:hypothetical protein